jgi:hypothetical protein
VRLNYTNAVRDRGPWLGIANLTRITVEQLKRGTDAAVGIFELIAVLHQSGSYALSFYSAPTSRGLRTNRRIALLLLICKMPQIRTNQLQPTALRPYFFSLSRATNN